MIEIALVTDLNCEEDLVVLYLHGKFETPLCILPKHKWEDLYGKYQQLKEGIL